MTGPGEALVRVLLVDDQELIRSGLRRILRRRDGFVIAGECADGAEVPGALAATPVDVVVMDLRMRGVDGIEATRRLRQSGDGPPVLVLSTFDDDELLAGALRAGAAGYLLKDSPAEDLIRAVRAVAAGAAWLDAAVTARVLSTYRTAAVDPSPSSAQLTAYQRDLLRAVGRGRTDAEIAADLAVPERTVRAELGQLRAKLGLRDRAAVIVYAFDHGVVTPGRADDTAHDVLDDVDLAVDDTPEVVSPQRIGHREPTVVTPVSPEPLRFCVLGPVRGFRGVTPLNLGPVRQQALLAALVLRPDLTVSPQELLDDVWGEEPPGTGGRVVPVYVFRLRTCLRVDGESTSDSVIVSARGGYRFASAGVWVDVARLADLAAAADAAELAGDPAAAVTACSAALDLYQGEPLTGLPGPFAEAMRFRLAERRIALVQRKARSQLRLGRSADTVGELSALLAANPYREPLAALLMSALYADGRRADALAVYERVRDLLARDLDVQPGPDLRRTHQAVRQEDDHYLGVPTQNPPNTPTRSTPRTGSTP